MIYLCKLIFKTSRYLSQYFVPPLIRTQRRLSGIKLHFQHAFLHGFEVTYELQEGLHFDVQLGDLFLGRILPLCLHLSLLLGMKKMTTQRKGARSRWSCSLRLVILVWSVRYFEIERPNKFLP